MGRGHKRWGASLTQQNCTSRSVRFHSTSCTSGRFHKDRDHCGGPWAPAPAHPEPASADQSATRSFEGGPPSRASPDPEEHADRTSSTLHTGRSSDVDHCLVPACSWDSHPHRSADMDRLHNQGSMPSSVFRMPRMTVTRTSLPTCGSSRCQASDQARHRSRMDTHRRYIPRQSTAGNHGPSGTHAFAHRPGWPRSRQRCERKRSSCQT